MTLFHSIESLFFRFIHCLKNGKSSDGFWGSIIIDRFGSSLTIEDVRIDGNFKDYYLDIKLPRQPVYWNESGPKKDQKKLRKEVEKANKTKK